jgi:hypothetical protein
MFEGGLLSKCQNAIRWRRTRRRRKLDIVRGVQEERYQVVLF